MSLASNGYSALKLRNVTIPEYQDTDDQGLFLVPSDSSDVTGYYLVASDANGKLRWGVSNTEIGGPDHSVQYNNNGELDGDSNFTWTSGLLSVNGSIRASKLKLGSLSIVSSTTTASYSLVLPPAQGANENILVNDGNGNLSWTVFSIGDHVTGPVSSTINSVVSFADTSGVVVKNNPDLIYANKTLTISGTSSGISLKGTSTGTTTLSTLNASSSNYICLIPTTTGVLVTSPSSSTANTLASFSDTSGVSIKNNADLTYVDSTLILSGTSSGISLKGASTGTTTLSTLNSSSSNYTINLPASTGSFVTSPVSATSGEVASYSDTTGTVITSSDMTYVSPILSLAGTSSSIILNDNILNTLNSSSSNYTCTIPPKTGTLALKPQTISYFVGLYPNYPFSSSSFTSTVYSTYFNGGLGSVFTFTPTTYTTLRIIANVSVALPSVNNTTIVSLVYGTGTPPTFNQINVGTSITIRIFSTSGIASVLSFATNTIFGVVTGLTLNTTYWFDLQCNSSPNAGYSYTIQPTDMTIEEVV